MSSEFVSLPAKINSDRQNYVIFLVLKNERSGTFLQGEERRLQGKSMNMRTKSLYPFGGQHCPVDIFGYSSNGVPGIEIVGMGKYSRSMKEKFIYLSREKKLKFPLRRFVLCVEGELESKKFKDEEYRYLELPLLLMLWSLTGHLPLEKLEDCFAAGKISVEGQISPLPLSASQQAGLAELFNLEEDQDLKIIAPSRMAIHEDYYHLPVEGLMESLLT